MTRRALVCRQVVEMVTDYLEGALSDDDRRAFEAHLSECDGCTEYTAQIRSTVAAVAARRGPATAGATPEAADALRRSRLLEELARLRRAGG